MTHHATLRFYAELKDFLPEDLQSGEVHRSFHVAGSVKDMIKACGIPHTEVDVILANGRSVDFSYLVDDGDRISVYPLFESFDISPIVRVRPEPLRTVRFVADNHLGRLARYLRLLGLDTTCENHWTDPQLVRISTGQRRILLTRDIELLKHGALTHGYYVRATDSRKQLKEIVRRFHLEEQLTPFTRCMTCNGGLVAVSKEEVTNDLSPHIRRNVDDFSRCTACGKVYWEGSHHPELLRIVASVRGLDPSDH